MLQICDILRLPFPAELWSWNLGWGESGEKNEKWADTYTEKLGPMATVTLALLLCTTQGEGLVHPVPTEHLQEVEALDSFSHTGQPFINTRTCTCCHPSTQTPGRLCHSHGSEVLVLDIAPPMPAIHAPFTHSAPHRGLVHSCFKGQSRQEVVDRVLLHSCMWSFGGCGSHISVASLLFADFRYCRTAA